MATKKIPFQYYLVQDKSSNPRKSGKWYAKRFMPIVLGTRGLAEHMMNHGVIAERSEIEDVLNGLVTCIPELLKQGVNVKLQGLGTFRVTLKGRGAQSIADYDVQKHVRGVRMRFIPDSTNLDNMTSKKFKSECSLGCVGYDDNGTVKPLSAYVAPNP